MDFGNFLSGGLAAPSTAISGTHGDSMFSSGVFGSDAPRIVNGVEGKWIAIGAGLALIAVIVWKKG